MSRGASFTDEPGERNEEGGQKNCCLRVSSQLERNTRRLDGLSLLLQASVDGHGGALNFEWRSHGWKGHRRFGEAALAVIYFLRTRGFGATSHRIHGRDQEPYGVGSYYMTQWFGRHLDSLLLLRQAAEVISASGERRNAVRSTQPNALARPSATPSRAIRPFGDQIVQRVCQPLVSARSSITALELPVVSPLPPSCS